MSTPIFFTKNIANGLAHLTDEEAFHCQSVLRKKAGDAVWVVDGEGLFCTGELLSVAKKSAEIKILTEQKNFKKRPAALEIAIAPTKNMERLEWFLEKATEIGIEKISLIRTKNSERTTVRHDRLEKILVAAMKQSVSAFLPKLTELIDFQSFIKEKSNNRISPLPGGLGGAFIAHCNSDDLPLLKNELKPGEPTLILIGPEGDFSLAEVELAEKNGFTSISLGTTRLRVETAGLVACTTFSLANS